MDEWMEVGCGVGSVGGVGIFGQNRNTTPNLTAKVLLFFLIIQIKIKKSAPKCAF